MELQSTKHELERGGAFLDEKVNICFEELRMRSLESEETRTVDSILEQDIHLTRHKLSAASVDLHEKIDVCLQQLGGFVT